MARILVVDDNLLARKVLREILTDAGHDVVDEAQDGLEAPCYLRQLHPDLVTLDLVMPGRGGLEVLKHMLLIDPTLAVVVCSASLDQARVIAALRLGATTYVRDTGAVLRTLSVPLYVMHERYGAVAIGWDPACLPL